MKKSKERVKRFLSTISPAGEKDELLITLFLGKRKIKYPEIPYAQINNSGRDKITYEQFEAWYNSNSPTVGDVVKNPDQGIIGLVTQEKWDSVIAGVSLSSGHICFEDYLWSPDLCVPATDQEKQDMQKALAKTGHDWNPIERTIIRRDIPQAARYVRLMVLGKQVGIGIFKAVLPDNTLEMYCVMMGNDPIRFEDSLSLGDADQFSFASTYDEHRALLQNALAEHDLIWNSRCQRIQKNSARVKLGKEYYWVSSYMEIKRSIEKGSISDNRRFNRGNYFLCREVAERVRAQMINLCKDEMLSSDNQRAR